jgi:hypothetical protein
VSACQELHLIAFSDAAFLFAVIIVTRVGDKAAILPMEKSKVNETKKARQVKSKVKSMLVIFFDIKGIVYKDWS